VVNLVATLGKTPGGVVETFKNLREGLCEAPFDVRGITFDNVIVIKTKEVEESYYTLKALFMCCLDFINVKDVTLPFDDVSSYEDFFKVRDVIRKVLKPGDFLDFSGGRKAISAAAVLVAREVGAHIVSSIIPHEEYEVANRLFSKVKDKAVRIYSKSECVSYICDLISKRAKTIVFF
jgi:hypothetical protein